MFFMLNSRPMFLRLMPRASLVDTDITSGLPFRRCAFAAIRTGVSVIPLASLARVLPVQGAMRRISRYPFGPMGSASSIFSIGFISAMDVIRSINWPVSPKRESVDWTLPEKTGCRMAPVSFRCLISCSIFAKVQKDPVTARPTCFPFNSIVFSLFLTESVNPGYAP